MNIDRQTDISITASFFGTRVVFDQLEFKPMTKDDIKDMASWPKFDEKSLSWANFPASTNELQNRWYRHQQKDHLVWIVIRNENNELIARCSLTEPLSTDQLLFGIVLRPDMLGKGLGTKITRVILRYIFEVTSYSAVWLESRYDNIRAIRTWEKIGFKSLGYHFRREVFSRYDKYLAFRYDREKMDELPEITIEYTT